MTTTSKVTSNPSIRKFVNERSASPLGSSIFQVTQGISIKKTAKALEHLTQSLCFKGYSVAIKDIRNITCVQGDHLVSIMMSYGPRRRECKGGHLLVNEDGLIQYDFFVGGCKYGAHLNSYLNHAHDGFTRNLPVQRILHFLSSNHSTD
jgi:hypothetical protein